MNRRMLVAVLVSSSLAGCGAGGGGRTSALPGSPAVATSAPSGGSSAMAAGRATVRLSIPRRASSSARHRDFVSPSTQGVSVTVTHKTGGVVDYNATMNYDVSPGSTTNCSGNDPQVCTLQIPAPVAPSPDTDSFAFTLYDQAPTGTPLAFGSFAHFLGNGTVVASIAPNVNNSISAYIGGRPTTDAFVPQVISGDGYLGFGSNFGIEALDAQQNVILGGVYDPYNPGFSVAVTDQNTPAGSTTLSLTVADLSTYTPAPPVCNAAASAVTSITTCRSSDVPSLGYLQPSASAFNTAYYATVAASTLVGPALYVSPIYISDATDTATATSGGPSFTQGSSGTSPALALDGGLGTVTLSEPGPTADGLPVSFTAAEGGTCASAIATGGITATSATTFTIQGSTRASGPIFLARHRSTGARVPLRARSAELTVVPCVVTFTDTYGGSVALVVSDAGESSSFIAIPGETLYAAQGAYNNHALYDLVNVQPGSTYFGDPYFTLTGNPGLGVDSDTQTAHTAPDQNGNYDIVLADGTEGVLYTLPVTAPTTSSGSYTVGGPVANTTDAAGTLSGGVAIDSQGNAYASYGSSLNVFSTPGLILLGDVSLPGAQPSANGIALDASGRVFVADGPDGVVDVFTNDLAGDLTYSYQYATGAGSDPQGVAIDPYGNLFVVLANDGGRGPAQSQLVVFSPGATTPTVTANVNPAGFGVAADAKGQVFVETAGTSLSFGGPVGGGIYQYTFTAATPGSPASLTSVGQLIYQNSFVDATGGYLNF